MTSSIAKSAQTLGREHQSLYGYTFIVEDSMWRLSKEITINVASITELLRPNIADSFLATLAHVAKTASPGHASNYADRFRHFIKNGGSDLTATAFINYKATLNRRTEWYLGALRSFFYKWFELSYPGIGEDVIDLLKGWTLRGCIRGDAVQRRDPRHGPLTQNELIAFNEGAARAFENGLIDVTELAMSLIMSSTGRRSIQIAHMKLVDVELIPSNMDGDPKLIVRIPRAKQHGATFREKFTSFGTTLELWKIVQAQRIRCIQCVEQVVGFAIGKRDRGLLPLFPDLEAIREVASVDELQSLLKSDRLHIVTRQVNNVLKKVVRAGKCCSERTGDLVDITSRRFRYTIGTRAAWQGLGIATIAELLDHSDHQNADVYVKNNPEHVEAIDQAIGSQLEVYAHAFQGKLVDSEEDAVRGADPASRIRYRGSASATCANAGPCAANVPIPCYTCMHFQPWLEGPHEAVYADLIAERTRILDETGDETMASVNDRTITAVAEVIVRCRKRQEELAAEVAS